MVSAGQKFRDLMSSPNILLMPGVFDGFSARLVEKFGFQAAGISGAGLSESHLGWADVGLMGLEENLRASRAIVDCCNLPLLADGDTGYGNAVNVYYAVRGFEKAGVAGVMIEDQVWPKRCGHMKGKEVISAEEMKEKVKAAVEARRDPTFVIKARTDSYATHGMKEVIRRLNLYADAGADLLFADAIIVEEDIKTLAKNVPKPLSVNMGFGIRRRPTTPLISAKRLQELGIHAVAYPRLLTSCAIQGMMNGLNVLLESSKKGEVIDRPDLAVSFDELNELMGLPVIQELEKKFLTEEQLKAKYKSK